MRRRSPLNPAATELRSASRRRLERIGRTACAVVVAWMAWRTFASLATLLRDRPAVERTGDAETSRDGAPVVSLTERLAADGVWTLGESGWSVASEVLDDRTIADRLHGFESRIAAASEATGVDPRFHRFDGLRTRLRLAVSDDRSGRFLGGALAQAADPKGVSWRFWEMRAGGAEGGGPPTDRLLPAPPGSNRLAACRSSTGELLVEIVEVEGPTDAIAFWTNSGWTELQSSDAGRIYQQGDRRVMAWTPPTPDAQPGRRASLWILMSASQGPGLQ